ncbi:MAG: hypothetical protein JXR37_26245 [Kiritimatiellae bacterium]|nr:hypothetical protein [Kiritimatiellia bacterium]
MPDLREQPWNSLVPLIPFADHCVSAEGAFWHPKLQRAGLADQHDAIFHGEATVQLTRWRLLDFTYPNPEQKCLEILLWGYPTGMQGQQHLAYLRNLGQIAAAAGVNATWREYYDGLNALGNLGISTITKLAYFFQRSFDGFKSLILDQKMISIMAEGRWEPLHMPALQYNNAVGQYVGYVKQIHMAAEVIHATPDQVELFLFSWGKSF